MTDLLTMVGSALTSLIGYFGQVVDALVTAEGALYALLPLVGLGIAVSLVFAGIKVVRSFCWGA